MMDSIYSNQSISRDGNDSIETGSLSRDVYRSDIDRWGAKKNCNLGTSTEQAYGCGLIIDENAPRPFQNWNKPQAANPNGEFSNRVPEPYFYPQAKTPVDSVILH